MSEIRETVSIDKIEAKVKIVEEKEENEVVDRHLITEVKIQYEGTPAVLDKVLYTLQAGHSINVTFTSPQLDLGFLDKEKETALAGK